MKALTQILVICLLCATVFCNVLNFDFGQESYSNLIGQPRASSQNSWGMGGLFNQFTTNVESLVKGTVDNIVDCFDKLFGGMNGKKRGPHSTLPDPNITNTTTTSTTSTTTSTTSTSTSTTSTSTSTTSTSTSTTSTTTPTPSTVAAGAGGAGRK